MFVLRPLVLLLALAGAAAAQPVVTVDLAAPSETLRLEGELEGTIERTEVPTSVLVVGVRAPVGRELTLVADVPLAVAATSALDPTVGGAGMGSRFEAALGNPGVGVEWGPWSDLTLGAVVRLPAYSQTRSTGLVGASSAPGVVWRLLRPEAREAFLPDLVSLRLSAEARVAVGERVGLSIEGGYVIGTTTGTQSVQVGRGEVSEERAAYGALTGRVGAEAQAGRLGVDVKLVTVERVAQIDEYRFPDASLLALDLSYASGLRPTLRVRLPLRDANGAGVAGSVGVGVTVGL